MKRFLYALRLWLWFAARGSNTEPFSWFLKQYDIREAIYKGEDI